MKYLERTDVIYKMSAKNRPVCKIQSGDTITIHTYDCFKEQLLSEGSTLNTLIFEELNPATGPIFIEGAYPGDTLKVEILKIELSELGVTEIDSEFGCLADRVKEPKIKRLPVKNGKIKFSSKLELECEPMIGVIGVAPDKEEVPTDTPGSHGGNMDCTQIKEGSTIYFPIYTEGALLSLGDLHACMGDGEIGGCGAEISGEVTLKISVISEKYKDYPVVITNDEVLVLASESTVEEAWKKAVQYLHEYLETETELSMDEAIILLSLAGNLAICQTVNLNKTVRMSIKKKYIEAYGFKVK